MDTDSYRVFRKPEYICTNIAKDVETKFDTSNYEFERPLLKEKNLFGLMKDN